ncbi:MAG: undecaprenyl-diphosphate phosphatase [Dorea sp.]|nr:undecaprenyl-diphosphate phosphatase [Dorea sp.]
MLDIIKVILLGIVEGITEWLPVSSTGHLILVGNLLKPGLSDGFMEMFDVVIQLGAIMAVVLIYFRKLNPFSKRKNERQKMITWQVWIKVLIASVPAAIIGLLFDDKLDELFYKPLPVAVMLIVYGVLFIVIEKRNKGMQPKVKNITRLTIPMVLIIGLFQVLALIPGTSRSGATIVGALLIGVSRPCATEFTFFLAIPVMFGASFLKLLKFGLAFSALEFVCLLIGSIVSFAVSYVAIKFLLGYVKKNDFTVFGYYRVILGGLIIASYCLGIIFA